MPWYCGLKLEQPKANVIGSALSVLGFGPRVSAPSSPEGIGVIVFETIDEAILRMLEECSGRGRERILAVSAADEDPSPEIVWELLHSGAADVLAWRDNGETPRRIQAQLERWAQVDQLLGAQNVQGKLVGRSTAWQTLLRGVIEAARFTDAPILLLGESGTGKELLARLVHDLDTRNPKPALVTVDCTTIVPELSGSELFGHERGAFTGAFQARDGAFALANKGSLFLDEVGELPLTLQAQLLRAVQEKVYKRVGGNAWQQTSFRLVCATNRDLQSAVERGEFRADLYYRLATWVFHVPPLRDRPEDILPLAQHFFSQILGPQYVEVDPAVRDYLLHREYPGNVRDLRQVVTRIGYRHVGPGAITAGDIPEDERPREGTTTRPWPDVRFEASIGAALDRGTGLKQISQAAAETAIRIAVQREEGNLQRAARRLGVTDRALQLRRANSK